MGNTDISEIGTTVTASIAGVGWRTGGNKIGESVVLNSYTDRYYRSDQTGILFMQGYSSNVSIACTVRDEAYTEKYYLTITGINTLVLPTKPHWYFKSASNYDTSTTEVITFSPTKY